jgi:cellulose synthase/poly-beta-1,6-N-acetylglucosamine synthase-like glycosyltransferase
MESKISGTIGIPTYNRLNYFKDAVSSALAQTYSNIEIWISRICTRIALFGRR